MLPVHLSTSSERDTVSDSLAPDGDWGMER